MARIAASVGAVSSAASMTASSNADLSSKTRKIVPSAIPAASAISRVVTAAPCSRKRGTVAATIAERRSSSGNAAARTRPWISVIEGEHTLSEDSLSRRRGPSQPLAGRVYWRGDRNDSPSTVPRAVAQPAPLPRPGGGARSPARRRGPGGEGDRGDARPTRDHCAACGRRAAGRGVRGARPRRPAPVPPRGCRPSSAPIRPSSTAPSTASGSRAAGPTDSLPSASCGAR